MILAYNNHHFCAIQGYPSVLCNTAKKNRPELFQGIIVGHTALPVLGCIHSVCHRPEPKESPDKEKLQPHYLQYEVEQHSGLRDGQPGEQARGYHCEERKTVSEILHNGQAQQPAHEVDRHAF